MYTLFKPPRLSSRSIDPSERPLNLIIAFDVLNLFSVIVLSAIFITAWFSHRIRRVSTWYLYIFSWIIFSLGYLLTFRYQMASEPPPFGLCLFQSMVIYATPAFASTSVVTFVAQIFLDIKFAMDLKFLHRHDIIKLLAVPWIIFFLVLVEVLTLGAAMPDTVERDASGMFCHSKLPFPRIATASIVFLNILTMIVLGILITSTIRKNKDTWQTLRTRPPLSSSESSSQTIQRFHKFNLMFRLGLFVLAPVIAASLIVIEFVPKRMDGAEVHVVYAILPATASLIFSSQRDILRVWMFWRSESRFTSSNTPTNSTTNSSSLSSSNSTSRVPSMSMTASKSRGINRVSLSNISPALLSEDEERRLGHHQEPLDPATVPSRSTTSWDTQEAPKIPTPTPTLRLSSPLHASSPPESSSPCEVPASASSPTAPAPIPSPLSLIPSLALALIPSPSPSSPLTTPTPTPTLSLSISHPHPHLHSQMSTAVPPTVVHVVPPSRASSHFLPSPPVSPSSSRSDSVSVEQPGLGSFASARSPSPLSGMVFRTGGEGEV